MLLKDHTVLKCQSNVALVPQNMTLAAERLWTQLDAGGS